MHDTQGKRIYEGFKISNKFLLTSKRYLREATSVTFNVALLFVFQLQGNIEAWLHLLLSRSEAIHYDYIMCIPQQSFRDTE